MEPTAELSTVRVLEDQDNPAVASGQLMPRTLCGSLFDRVRRTVNASPVSWSIIVVTGILMLSLAASSVSICVPDSNSTNAGEEGSGLDEAGSGGSGEDCLDSKSYLTIMLTCFALVGMCNDMPPDLILLGVTVLLLMFNIISQKDAWAGFSSPSILAIAALFVFARALEETRAVELIVRPLLGQPHNHMVAVLRLCFPAALSSAFLNNTPIVAMLIPITEAWASRSRLSERVLLMPLSFSSMLGGMCTLIGTSTNLVLNARIDNDADPPCKPFEMFSMTPVALPAALAGILLLALLAPRILTESPGGGDADTGARKGGEGGHGAPDEPSADHDPAASPYVVRTYDIRAMLLAGSELIGEPLATLEALCGRCVSLHRPGIELEPTNDRASPQTRRRGPANRNNEVEISLHPVEISPRRPVEGGDQLAPDKAASETADPPVAILWSPTDPQWGSLQFQVGDVLTVSCTADSVPVLRRLRGVRAEAEAASEMLGSHRRHRCLHELVLSSRSPLVGLSITAAARLPMMREMAIWAVRLREFGPGGGATNRLQSVSLKYSRDQSVVDQGNGPCPVWPELSIPPTRQSTSLSSLPRTPSTNGFAVNAGSSSSSSLPPPDAFVRHNRPLQSGDTLLCEAASAFSEEHRSDDRFALTTVVRNSMPPREDTAADRLRFFASIAALFTLLIVSATDYLKLVTIALLLVYVLVGMQALTVEQAWNAINYRVLITIASSFGLGSGLENTNVSALIAHGLVQFGKVSGALPFLLAVFFLTSLLSCVVSNSATVVLLYSVLRRVTVEGLTARQSLLMLMLGASAAFATPIGYQTNLMVLSRGGYRFSDFTLLGALLTLVVGFVSALFTYILI